MSEQPSTAAYSPARSISAKLQRRLIQWKAVAPLASSPASSLVSFTFDDFPKSAADTGADILEAVGARGTYYACSRFSGQSNIVGDLFDERDIAALAKAGHEIGSHTRGHIDCAQTPVEIALADIENGDADLAAMGGPAPITQFAYPFGETRLALKRALKGRYRGARGVLFGMNQRGSDALQLRAIEIDADSSSHARAMNAIDYAARKPVWLVFFTHDVRASASPFGVTPSTLKQISIAVRDAGLPMATMSGAMDVLGAADS